MGEENDIGRFKGGLLGLLFEMRSPSTKPTRLTFALEEIGHRLATEQAVPLLLPFLGHEDAMVREGAIYGLTGHVDEAIDAKLKVLAHDDPSPGVREAAASAIEGR